VNRQPVQSGGTGAGPRLHSFVALVIALVAASPVFGATFRIDETGTVVDMPVLNMRWHQLVPGRSSDNMVEGTVRADLRLNLAPWINKPARIYMVLAPVNGERVRARWTTQGRLLPGSIHSGERALVFEGPAGPAIWSESILLTLEADGQRLVQLQTLNFYFEIEVSP
jgi:hypothetical protein